MDKPCLWCSISLGPSTLIRILLYRKAAISLVSSSLSVCTCGHLFYPLSYDPTQSLPLVAQLAPSLAMGHSVRLAQTPLQCALTDHFLTFWHHRMLQMYLVFSLPRLWNQPVFQGVLVPFIREWHLKPRSMS